jgi:hypothetical protein
VVFLGQYLWIIKLVEGAKLVTIELGGRS